MIPLNAFRLLILSVLSIFSCSVFAADNLFIFVFKNGVAQNHITVTVGEVTKETNDYGLANFAMPAGEYEVGYYSGEELFAVSEVKVIEKVSGQVFLNLTSEGAEADLDLPLASYAQSFEHAQMKQQHGPKGLLELSLKNSEDDTPIANAKLFFKGYNVEGSSDDNGVAKVELAEGTYDITVVHPKFVMQVIKGVKVKAKATTNKVAKMLKSNILLEDIVVVAPVVEGSLASTFAKLKDSDVLGEAISSEQFSKSGDSTASGALKRVTGITIVDDKFVYVRGLGERYSSILLNGLLVPSPEPTKRVVPLDIFPAGVIQSMDIQKTWSSDQPGTFAGGNILINTKDIPKEDNFIQGSLGLAVNDTTGKEVVYNPDNDTKLPSILIDLSDDFGVLTQEVKIGDTVLAEGITPEQKESLNRSMVSYRDYGLQSKSLAPGNDFSATLGQSFKTPSGLKYGVAGALYRKTNEKSGEIEVSEFQFDADTQDILRLEDDAYEVAGGEEKFGGLISVGFETLSKQKLKYTLLTLNENGDATYAGDIDELKEGRESERTYLEYVEKTLLSHQLNGSHQVGEDKGGFLDDIEINWGASLSKATRLEPGTFEYEYKEANGEFVVDAKKLFYLYSDLEDKVNNYRLDLSIPFTFNKQKNHTNLGLFILDKTRDLDNRRFKVKYTNTLDNRVIDDALSVNNVDNGTIEILDSYRPDDFYVADQSLTAFYVSQLISPLPALDISLGVRQETSTQELKIGEEEEVSSLETSDSLPFLGATYRINDAHQLRFGYSTTLSRPDFREFSENRYKDPLTGNIVQGYDGLVSTEIKNYDIKYEWYPSYDEFYSISFFIKDFKNPIEEVRTVNDVDVQISYRNAEFAKSSGIEIGFRQKLDEISFLQNYVVSGNYAYIHSEIELDKDSPKNQFDEYIPFLTSESRPMQGQSPYVLNLQFGYDNVYTKRSAMFSYNVFGERIATLGINGNPDLYEQPVELLDFVVKWAINDTYDEQRKKLGYTVSLKAKNLLDSEMVVKQGSEVSEVFRPGRSINLGFSLKY